MANCTICGEEFVPPDNKTNVCGTCGQILMDEEEAYEEQKRHEGEEMERALNKEAYEEREQEAQMDTAGGWRFC